MNETSPVTYASRGGLHAAAASAFLRLDRWGWQRGWEGSDPYDGLNATRIASPLKQSVLGRRVLTQAVKHSPLDLRPILGIRPSRSATATGLLVSAYAIQPLLDAEQTEARLGRLLEVMLGDRLSQFDEPCWGYHFDVQTRVFFYPKGSPNTIATAFAGLALLDAHARIGSGDLLDTARGVADFFAVHVPQTEAASGAYFGYLVGDRTPIHNANMLVAAFLARVSHLTRDRVLAYRAQAAVDYTVAHQRRDGSWPYGEEPGLAWVDNFHTAYVLLCLDICRRCGLSGCEESLERGLHYYESNFFRRDGAPRYYPGSTYPVETQCAAEALRVFSLVADRDSRYELAAERTLRYTLQALARPDGAFVFRRERFWVNRQAHVRWVQAPLLAAFASFLRACTHP